MNTATVNTAAHKVLYTVEEARRLIGEGTPLMLAASEDVLRQLPRGAWIGGTTPYFMGDDGGVYSNDHALITPIAPASAVSVRRYDEASLPRIPADAPENGYSILILPAGSTVHRRYAEDAATYDGLFFSPIVGWVAGTALDQIGAVTPKIIDGQTGETSETDAIVMHITLPADIVARVDIVNIFAQGGGDVLTFPRTDFTIDRCMVNGEETSFAQYVTERGIDTRLPLVADFHGAMINTSFQTVDTERGVVTCYAPVFDGTEYRVASPIANYAGAFRAAVPSKAADTAFACNCILNYVYGELEGKRVGLMGPMTFGEIAYHLVNQTLVYLTHVHV